MPLSHSANALASEKIALRARQGQGRPIPVANSGRTRSLTDWITVEANVPSNSEWFTYLGEPLIERFYKVLDVPKPHPLGAPFELLNCHAAQVEVF